MSSLKDIAVRYYVERLAQRVSHAPQPHDGEKPEPETGENSPSQEVQLLAVLGRHREALVQRLKETDVRRGHIFQRVKERWKKKQREVKQMRQKLRILKRLLRKRRHAIRELSARVVELRRMIVMTYANPHMAPLPEMSAALPGNGWAAMGNRLFNRLQARHALLWKGWMRLGVLKQYSARPLVVDRLPTPKLPPEALPKISIVTPCYNQAGFIETTMRSVLDQDYPHLEYIVMDGGSIDGSDDIIRRFEKRLTFWQSAPDEGQADAVCQGFEKATGDIMGWVNSDDVLLPGALAFIADYFARHPNVDFVYGHRIIINNRGHEVGRWVLPRHDAELLLWVDFIPQETCFWRRSAYEKVGGIDPTFQFALDWDLFLRFQHAGARFERLPYFLGAFRIHNEQKNFQIMTTTGQQEIAMLRDRELGADFTRTELASRVNKAQFRAILLTWLLRFRIRW